MAPKWFGNIRMVDSLNIGSIFNRGKRKLGKCDLEDQTKSGSSNFGISELEPFSPVCCFVFLSSWHLPLQFNIGFALLMHFLL